MKIETIKLHEIAMPLLSPFETSFGVTQARRILLIEVHSEGLVGWGEVTAGESPSFNPECVDMAWVVLEKFLIPLLLNADVQHPSEVPQRLSSVRGSEMSKAALENAVWDIEAQKQNVSLSHLLGGTQREISCGVSIGIKKSVQELLDTVEREVSAGYQRIKIKIKPGHDIEITRAVRERFPDILLSVDANSAYTIDQVPLLKELDQFKLLMIEQPLQWNEIYLHSKLQEQIETAICLDECIQNARHASAAIALGACRILNVKLGRVGGHTEAQRIQTLAKEHGIAVWSGGMLEAGIGRAHNIAMASQPGFVLPGDISASKRYWNEDIIEPAVTVTPFGTIVVPQTSGLGYKVRPERIRELTTAQKEFVSTAAAVAV